MSDSKWEDNSLQFPRLLAEIYAVGLTDEQWTGLADSMDLELEFVNELFERAQEEWDAIKERLL